MVPTEIPGPAWPAASAVDSNLSWPSGHQPARFETWPQTGFGTHNFRLMPCWKTRVVRDTASGWPGTCMSLIQARIKETLLDCRDLCWNEPRCAVWQFTNSSGDLQCWVGFGTNCDRPDADQTHVQVVAAQRFQHGDVRVLRNITGLRIHNLWHLGDFHESTQEKNIAKCRAWCYADVACQYWQYGSTGCWVDAPFFSTHKGQDKSQVVQYPLTSSGLSMDPDMVAGEYLQHYCPPKSSGSEPELGDSASDGASLPGSSNMLWGLVFFGILFLACAGFLVWAIAHHRLTGGDKKKRSMVRAEINEQDSSYSDVEDRQPLMDASPPQHTREVDARSCASSFYAEVPPAVRLNPGPPLRAELPALPHLAGPPMESAAHPHFAGPSAEPVWVPKLMSFQSGWGPGAPSLQSFSPQLESFSPQLPARQPSHLLQPPVPVGLGGAPGSPLGTMRQFGGGAPSPMPFSV